MSRRSQNGLTPDRNQAESERLLRFIMLYQELIKNFEQELKDFPHKMSQVVEMLAEDIDYSVATTPSDVVYTQDKMKLLHYRSAVDKQKIHSTPVLIVYALINRYIMLDLEPGRSFVQGLLDQGLDVYLIDWGYPSGADRYLDLEDYIDGYIDSVVDWIRAATHSGKINIMGVCMGGTFSVIYTALYPDKIKNLVTFATPINTDIDDSTLFLWVKKIDIDKAVETFGNLPGHLANFLYLLAVPVASVDKYIQFFENADNSEFVSTFLRMEKWSFDSPDMSGEVLRQYSKDIIQKNLLIKNELVIGKKQVSLRNITCPLLNIFGHKDHLVPPSSAKPLSEAVASDDVTTQEFSTGHIGMFVGRNAQKTVVPETARWIRDR